nr:hypothetical protein GCM10025699_36170 [Microbacterium flavescens]
MHRRAAGVVEASPAAPADTYARLLSLLRSGHGTEGEEGWLGRELEQAVRARSEIVVVVRMPDGSERTLTLEASGLGGGACAGETGPQTSSGPCRCRASSACVPPEPARPRPPGSGQPR